MKPFMLRKKKKLVAVARRKILSARMGDTRDYRMTTIDSVLRRSLDDRSGELILTLDPHFQGLPDTAHGGSGSTRWRSAARGRRASRSGRLTARWRRWR